MDGILDITSSIVSHIFSWGKDATPIAWEWNGKTLKAYQIIDTGVLSFNVQSDITIDDLALEINVPFHMNMRNDHLI